NLYGLANDGLISVYLDKSLCRRLIVRASIPCDKLINAVRKHRKRPFDRIALFIGARYKRKRSFTRRQHIKLPVDSLLATRLDSNCLSSSNLGLIYKPQFSARAKLHVHLLVVIQVIMNHTGESNLVTLPEEPWGLQASQQIFRHNGVG